MRQSEQLFDGVPSDITKDYNLQGRQLGHGAAGTVRLCVSKQTGELLACKTICKALLKSVNRVEDVRKEVQVLLDLADHPNVVHLKGIYEDAKYVHIVEELCNGGELFDEVAKTNGLPEEVARRLFRQVAQGLAACHKKGWLHRDIKLENVMLCRPSKRAFMQGSRSSEKNSELTRVKAGPDQQQSTSIPTSKRASEDGRTTILGATVSTGSKDKDEEPLPVVKLVDFGLSVNIAHRGLVKGAAGSLHYMAPEVVRRGPYGLKADSWSLGVLLYTMLSGSLPFNGDTEGMVVRAVKRGAVKLHASVWQDVSAEAKDLVLSLLALNPEERLSPEEVLRHPWLATAEPITAADSKATAIEPAVATTDDRSGSASHPSSSLGNLPLPCLINLTLAKGIAELTLQDGDCRSSSLEVKATAAPPSNADLPKSVSDGQMPGCQPVGDALGLPVAWSLPAPCELRGIGEQGLSHRSLTPAPRAPEKGTDSGLTEETLDALRLALRQASEAEFAREQAIAALHHHKGFPHFHWLRCSYPQTSSTVRVAS